MAYQGMLDGLCGPYAIVNAYHQCDIEEDWLGEDIFKTACTAIEGWPEVLWDGTSFEQMIEMLNSCQQGLAHAYGEAGVNFPIEVDYPFIETEPPTNAIYWNNFNQIFDSDNVVCGIVGMEHPEKHWFAFTNGRNALLAFDSAPASWGGMQRMPRNQIHAGVNNINNYVLNRRELIVFRET